MDAVQLGFKKRKSQSMKVFRLRNDFHRSAFPCLLEVGELLVIKLTHILKNFGILQLSYATGGGGLVV